MASNKFYTINRFVFRHFVLIFTSMFFIIDAVSLVGQSYTPQLNDIKEFADLLKHQNAVSPLDITDLKNKKFIIYWLYPDRRSARAFRDRISSYAGDQNTTLIYRWAWPDSLIVSDDQIPIVVYGSDKSWPSVFSSDGKYYKIRIGSMIQQDFNSNDTHHTGLQLTDGSKGIMDLAAQYIMNGITPDDQGKIIPADRMAFLPPSYFGLDEAYITQQLDSILQMGLDSAAYPGAEVSIAYKGAIIYQKAIGFHSYEKKYSVRPHDLYDLASLTKVVGGVNALMTMYEQGQFSLDKTLSDYFPYFRRSDKGDLEMKRILTHSAGLTPYLVYYEMAKKSNGRFHKNTLSPTRHGHYQFAVTDSIYVSDRFNRFIYKSIKDSPLLPGQEYKYSGLFFLLIPDLVKQKTGQSLDEYLEDTIFHSLGAYNTVYNPTSLFNINQIIPTETDQVWRHRVVQGQVHDEAAVVLGGVSANAGLFSTGTDLIKIGETWRRNGKYGGKTYWSAETMSTFTHCYYCEEGNRRALGFDRPPLPDHPVDSYMSPLASQESYGHSGFTGTMIWVDPAVDYTFVFLSNRVNPTRENNKLSGLNIRPALHSVLYKTLDRGKMKSSEVTP